MSLDNSAPFCAKLIIEHPDCMLRINIHNKRDNTIIHTVSVNAIFSFNVFRKIGEVFKFYIDS